VARIPARRQRGGYFLKARKQFSLNPRLPANRGFFVFWPTNFDGQRFLKGNMKQKNRQIRTRFKPETRFKVGALAPVPYRGPVESELEQLKERLLEPLLTATADQAQSVPLRLAANEAAGLAWFTPFPLLFFPALLEEKIYAAQRQEARQQQIHQRTQGLLGKAEEQG
jgi:hypothetical protein